MSLQTRITELAQAVGADIKALQAGGAGGTSLLSFTYANRGDLRTTVGTHAVVDRLGLFEFVAGSDEPDDDETCFATATGKWLLAAVHWDYVDSQLAPELSARDLKIAAATATADAALPRSLISNGSTAISTFFKALAPGVSVESDFSIVVGAYDFVAVSPGFQSGGLGKTPKDSAALTFSMSVVAPNKVRLVVGNSSPNHVLSFANNSQSWSLLIYRTA